MVKNPKSQYRNPKQARNNKFEIRKSKSLFGICNLWLLICLGFRASCFGFEAKRQRSAGFTLLEMLVVIAIFGILSAVVIFNYSAFTNGTLLTNTAYEMALHIRNAQVFGIAARNSETGFKNSYGIHVDIVNSPESYTFFADTRENNRFDSVDQIIETFNFERGIVVDDVKVTAGSFRCRSVSVFKNLSVIFERPNSEAVVNGYRALERTEIVIKSPQESYRYVNILNNGQIYVDSKLSCE
jgi:prepilin-type N-terminal cleavage/methylation domain-containing protein